MPAPTNKEGVLRLLGTINYLDKLIQNNADLQVPISQLAQKDKVFLWDKQGTFGELKSVIVNAPAIRADLRHILFPSCHRELEDECFSATNGYSMPLEKYLTITTHWAKVQGFGSIF